MSKKNAIRFTIGPLQRVAVEDITDPAERAALDEAHRRAKGIPAAKTAKSKTRRAAARKKS